MIGEGLGEWFEAPSYEEGVGVDGKSEGEPSDGVWGYPPARDEHLAVWCWARIPHWRMEGRDLGALRVVDCKAKPCEFCKEMAKFALKWEIIANSLENCNKSCTFATVYNMVHPNI